MQRVFLFGVILSHFRVIPRDFFNEAKLLKCLGQFELCIHERRTKLPIMTEYIGASFDIRLNELDASLYCYNYYVSLLGHKIYLKIPYNSKSAYPLIAEYKNEKYYVFDENGKFMPNFGVNV